MFLLHNQIRKLEAALEKWAPVLSTQGLLYSLVYLTHHSKHTFACFACIANTTFLVRRSNRSSIVQLAIDFAALVTTRSIGNDCSGFGQVENAGKKSRRTLICMKRQVSKFNLCMPQYTVKSRVLTRLVQKHMQAFSGLLMKGIFDPYVLW